MPAPSPSEFRPIDKAPSAPFPLPVTVEDGQISEAVVLAAPRTEGGAQEILYQGDRKTAEYIAQALNERTSLVAAVATLLREMNHVRDHVLQQDLLEESERDARKVVNHLSGYLKAPYEKWLPPAALAAARSLA